MPGFISENSNTIIWLPVMASGVKIETSKVVFSFTYLIVLYTRILGIINCEFWPDGEMMFIAVLPGLRHHTLNVKCFISRGIESSEDLVSPILFKIAEACPLAEPWFPNPQIIAVDLLEARVFKYLVKIILPSWLSSVLPVDNIITTGLFLEIAVLEINSIPAIISDEVYVSTLLIPFSKCVLVKLGEGDNLTTTNSQSFATPSIDLS